MAHDLEKLRKKIGSNGFSVRDLLNIRSVYKELKSVYHPRLTQELSFESVIIEEARKSFSLVKYYFLAVVLSALVAIFWSRPDFLFMPVAFFLLILSDVKSSAKNRNRTFCNELKLIKLAIRIKV